METHGRRRRGQGGVVRTARVVGADPGECLAAGAPTVKETRSEQQRVGASAAWAMAAWVAGCSALVFTRPASGHGRALWAGTGGALRHAGTSTASEAK